MYYYLLLYYYFAHFLEEVEFGEQVYFLAQFQFYLGPEIEEVILGLLVFALGGDEDDTGRYEYDTERIYYNGSWYTDMREEYANPLDSVWIIPEDAETVEAKPSYAENGKKDVSGLTYKNKDLQMFLSLGADWPALYIKEDYALPNYRNLKEIETIAMEYYTSDFEAVRMVIKDRDEIKTIQADMLRATEKESWKKEAITKDMIVEEWDVYIKYSGVGAEYHYGTLVPLEEEKTFGISKLMLEDMNMSFDVISDAAIFDSMEILPVSDKTFQLIKKHWLALNK